ncbi:hypothetical protein HanIR_Chr01g0037251 [Helianthus annuus]|nr:hypothetical protein HanIR_Chr01g0037251 [Helianthus annuus]
MSKWYPVSVSVSNFSNRNNFDTDSVPTFEVFCTGIYPFLHSNTGTELYRTKYFRYWYPFLGIFGTDWYRAHP